MSETVFEIYYIPNSNQVKAALNCSMKPVLQVKSVRAHVSYNNIRFSPHLNNVLISFLRPLYYIYVKLYVKAHGVRHSIPS